jgi:glycosyltransferase involved in cell wall biosynthesis
LWPHLFPQRAIDCLVQKAEAPTPVQHFNNTTKQLIGDWLTGAAPAWAKPSNGLPPYSIDPPVGYRFRQHLRFLLPTWSEPSLQDASVYLNVAPFGTPGPIYLRWLDRHPDIKAVFFVHDLLPLDHPELFPKAWRPFHSRMISAILKRANGIIVASDVIRERVERELSQHRRSGVKIHVAHLPPSPIFRAPLTNALLQAHPYFVMCGTIEPRKNHPLILELWRRLRRQQNGKTPRLILIGKRGWGSEQTFAMLDRDRSLRSIVLEANALPDSIQHWLLSNACGALFPSLAEGYGLPLVEALSLGIPAVASAIPVLREVSQGHATFCSPHDVEAWQRTILSLSDRSTSSWTTAASRARQFRPPTIDAYFTSVLHFLQTV